MNVARSTGFFIFRPRQSNRSVSR
ncbi:hypothetical protein EVJ34_09260 [Exiguobacterium sp. SL-9]|nr:hypothetical protein EVJ34_09260 [Exiguobacterium sp. SL-9]